MNIAIIGAGFTGLSAAYRLGQQGHTVTILEKDSKPGGLAIGYKDKNWNWTLEEYYHHWFTNDESILGLAKELGYEVLIKRPKTSVYVQNNIYQLDSPLLVLKFPLLSIIERLRMAAVLGFLRFDPFWKPLEGIHAATFLQTGMGKKAYEIIWKPQLQNKFGKYLGEISLAWFWARIAKRTSSLAYPKGGFLDFANFLARKIEEKGKIIYGANVEYIKEKNGKIALSEKYKNFDKVIVTIPTFGFLKLCPDLPKEYTEKLKPLKGLGAMTLVLRLKDSFLKDGTYWLSVCDLNSPVLAIVEHTNFMDKKNYNNEHIVYLGNYLAASDPTYSMDKKELLKKFDPYLKKINPNYEKSLIGMDVFKVPFAQPIIPINYSNMVPPFKTPIKNVFLVNMQQVYPWDRGTNYAVELGEKAANLLNQEA